MIDARSNDVIYGLAAQVLVPAKKLDRIVWPRYGSGVPVKLIKRGPANYDPSVQPANERM